MFDDTKKSQQIFTQLKEFIHKPNGGIIKIVLRDGSTVIGLYKTFDYSPEKKHGVIELTNGRRIDYKDIDNIV